MKLAEGLNDLTVWFLALIHFLLALMAGGMKELNRLQSRKFSFRNMVSGMAVSSFSGLITYLILDYCGLAWQLVAAGTGIAGWSGSLFLDYLSLVAKKKILKIMDVNITPDEERSHSELINK